MIQVREFLNYQDSQDSEMNAWLKENPNIKIKDIKYSVSTFQADDIQGYDAQPFSGALIIYEDYTV